MQKEKTYKTFKQFLHEEQANRKEDIHELDSAQQDTDAETARASITAGHLRHQHCHHESENRSHAGNGIRPSGQAAGKRLHHQAVNEQLVAWRANLNIDPSQTITLFQGRDRDFVLSFIDCEYAADWFASRIIEGTDSPELQQFMHELSEQLEFLPVMVDDDGYIILNNKAAV